MSRWGCFSNGLADPFLTRLDLGIVTGIPVSEAGDGLKIYPNPANDKVFIENNEGMEFYTILNTYGQEVRSGILSGVQTEITLENIPTGIYFIEISKKNNVKKSSKLIKY